MLRAAVLLKSLKLIIKSVLKLIIECIKNSQLNHQKDARIGPGDRAAGRRLRHARVVCVRFGLDGLLCQGHQGSSALSGPPGDGDQAS
jgi:hypothetical protein